MRLLSFRKAVLLASAAICFGAAGCKAKPGNSTDDPKAESAPAETADSEESEPAKPMKPMKMERFTLPEINQVLLKLKACVDTNTDLHYMAQCGCLSDLVLSNEPQPEDPEAYCSDFADKTVATSKLPEAEQKKQEYLLAAKDVPAPGSTAIFSFAAPCMMKAFEKRSKQHHNLCVCAAHALANGMADRSGTMKTAEEVIEAMSSVGDEMQEYKVCQ